MPKRLDISKSERYPRHYIIHVRSGGQHLQFSSNRLPGSRARQVACFKRLQPCGLIFVEFHECNKFIAMTGENLDIRRIMKTLTIATTILILSLLSACGPLTNANTSGPITTVIDGQDLQVVLDSMTVEEGQRRDAGC